MKRPLFDPTKIKCSSDSAHRVICELHRVATYFPSSSGGDDHWLPHSSQIFAWRPREGEMGLPPRNSSIYVALSNRIEACEQLKVHPDTQSRERRREICELQDQNLMLAIYMDRSGRYDDDHYLKEEEGREVLKLFRPDTKLTFTQEDVPDVTSQLLAVDFWEKNNSHLRFKHPADVAIARMFTKAQPKPCVPREFAETMKGFWNDPVSGDYVFDFWRRTMAGGLLGIYDHCETTANFAVRYSVYSWLFYDEPNVEKSMSWIEENGKLHMYTIRELLFWTSAKVSAFDEFMTERYFWRRMRANAYEAMDRCRKLFNIHSLDPHFDVAHKECKIALSDFNNQNLMYSSRLCTNSFNRKVVVECAIADADARDEKPPGADIPTLPPDVTRTIDTAVYKFHREKDGIELGFDWLAPIFGVSVSGAIHKLQQAAALEKAEVKQTAVALALKDIRHTLPRDFGIIQYFFMALEKTESLASARLPKEISMKQIETLKRNNFDYLPRSAGLHYICPSCGFFKSEVKLNTKRHNQISTKMYMNLATGKNYCAVIFPRGSKAAARRSRPGNSSAKPRVKKAKTVVRKEKTDFIKKECVTTEVLEINMIGKIVSTPAHGEVLLCPDCGKLMEYSIDAFRDGLPSCGCMKEDLTKKRRKKKKKKVKKKKGEEHVEPPPLTKCIDCNRVSSTHILHFAFTKEGKVVKCRFCEEHLKWRLDEKKFFLDEKMPRKGAWKTLKRTRDGYYFA